MVVVALLCTPAVALTSHQSGPLFDLAAGVGFRGAPLAPTVAGELSFGWWLGVYDDQYAFGRYWALVGNGRVDYGRGGLAVTPTLEVRRGIELIVAGLYGALGGGLVVVEGGSPGWTARGALGGKFRRTRAFGLTLRLEAGVDGLGDRLGFAGGVLLGGALARPARRIEGPV